MQLSLKEMSKGENPQVCKQKQKKKESPEIWRFEGLQNPTTS